MKADPRYEATIAVMARALSLFIKEGQGLIIHHNEVGFIVYLDPNVEQLMIVDSEDALNLKHGTVISLANLGLGEQEQTRGPESAPN